MKYRDHILIGFFCAAISLPLIVQLAGKTAGASASEKRQLAPRPGFPRSWSALREWPGKFATYYGDNFGSRSQLIRLYAVGMYRLLGMSPTEKVLKGKDGWLHYADDASLDDYRSLKPFTSAELERWRAVMEERHDWLAQRGAKLVIVFACDKHIIYPEFLPTGYHRAPHPYRVQVLAEHLRKNSKLNIVSLPEPLLAAKGTDRLYHRTDTHWNDRGALCGYLEIARTARFEPLPYTPARAMTPGWDLARMMGLDDLIVEEDLRLIPVQPRRARIVDEDRRDENWNQGRVILERDDPHLPVAVMFRDSFGSALIPFLTEHFRRSVYLWQYDFDPSWIEKEKPQLVIWLMTSRRLQWYVPYNPPLPAKAN